MSTRQLSHEQKQIVQDYRDLAALVAGPVTDPLAVAEPPKRAIPTITDVNPPQGSGPPRPTSVTVTGEHLINPTQIFFGDVPGAIKSKSPTQVSADVPAGLAAGDKITISVLTDLGLATATEKFTVQ